MKTMIMVVVGLLALGLTAGTVQAETLTISSATYIGHILDGIPSSEALELSYITNLITLAAGAGPTQIPAVTGEFYDRLGSPYVGALPTPTSPQKSGDDPSAADIPVTGRTYILAKYDADHAGSFVWYVGGMTSVTLPAQAGGGDGEGCDKNDTCGLSHYTTFNGTSVPDGGATLMLLGGALVGLETLRRKFRG